MKQNDLNTRYTETHESWNNVAQLYNDHFMDLELYDDTYEAFVAILPVQNASVLELGCGPGNITRHLLHLNPGLQLIATDIAPNMVSLAKVNNPSAEIMQLDCRDLSSIDGTFDGIVCGFTIPYLSASDCQKLFADCSSLLNSNGCFYISYVEGNTDNSGYISGSTGDRMYFYFHEPELILQLLAANHFEILEIIHKEYIRSKDVIETHTIILSKKKES